MATNSGTDNGLIQSIQSILSKWKAEETTSNPSPLPTALDFYQVGKVLSQLSDASVVRHALRSTIESLPDDYRIEVFHKLFQGLMHVLETETNNINHHSRAEALSSMAQLFQVSPRIPAHYRLDSSSVSLVLKKYEIDRDSSIVILVAKTLVESTQYAWEDYLSTLHTLQENSLLWNDLLDWLEDHQPGWRQTIQNRYSDHAEYLTSFFDRQQRDDSTTALQDAIQSMEQKRTKKNAADTTSSGAVVAPAEELQRRLDHVRQVLPDLGEGFVELCLSFYKGDVDQTVSALLDESSLPPVLRLMDRELPRRRVEGESKEEEEEARRIAKATLQAAQKQQEEEAYMLDRVMREGAHDEYNDDYDDQYDDTEGIQRASDQGLYDNYDAVRTYNRILKGVEDEQTFWEENRNTNRQPVPKNQSNNGDKSYRGPDKGRGGRVPQAHAGGRARGGGRGRGRGGGGARGRGTSPQTKDDGTKATEDKNASNLPNDSNAKGGDSKDSGNPNNGSNGKGGRGKDRKLASRRERQKKALEKRSG